MSGDRGALRPVRSVVHPAVAAVVVAAALSGVPSAARGQTISWLRIMKIDGAVELGVDDKHENRYHEGGSTIFTSDQLELTETAIVDLSGYSYHPKLLQFVGTGRLTLFQDVRQDRYYVLPTGRLMVRILREHPYGATLRANVSRTEVDRSFERTYRLLYQTYGATAFYRRRGFRSDGGYRYERRSRTGGGAELYETTHEIEARGRYESSQRTRGEGRYRLLFENIRGDALATRDLRIQTLSWRQVTKLDAAGHNRAIGIVRLRDQAGVSDTTSVAALGELTWRHLPSLTSDHRLSLRFDDFDGEVYRSVEELSSLRHQLYLSLTSTGELTTRVDDTSSGASRRVRGDIREQYTKRLGSFGRLNIDASPFGEWLQDRPERSVGTVVDEPVTLAGLLPVRLSQVDVDPATVVVTDADGIQHYAEGVDYVVTQRGVVVELSRVASGDIADGERVLVDYAFALTGDADIVSSGFITGASVQMPYGVTVFAKYEQRHQRALSAEVTPRLEQVDATSAGVRWRRRWMRVNAELAKRLSTFTSYWAATESLRLVLPASSWLRANVGGLHNFTSFFDEGETVTRFAGDALVGAQIGTRWSVEARADYLRERWTGGDDFSINDADAVGAKLQVRYQVRRLTATLEARIARVQRAAVHDDYSRVFLLLRREIGR